MKKLMLLIVAFATIGHLHSEETDPSRIIGGDVINIEDAPWQVALFNGNSVRVWCGGIIIHPEFILTARHCIDDLGEDGLRNLNIHAGIRCVDDRNNDTRLRFNTGSIIRHPNYDIVLIRLSTPIIFDDTRQPIGLASPPSMGDVSTSGWGDTKSGMIPGSSRSSCLRSVDLEIISHDVANSRLGNYYWDVFGEVFMLPIEPHEVAAAKKQSSPNNENEGACDGDSGGPLVHNNALIGVTSRGAKECGRAQAPHNNLPTIFVRADFITVWLDEKIAEELEKEPLPPGLPEDLRGVCFEPFGPDVICAYGGSFGYTNMNFEPYFTGWSVSQGLTKVHETTTTITVVPNSFSGTREHVLVYFGDYDDYIHFQVCNPDDIKLYIDGPDIVCGTQAFHVNNPNRFPIQWSIDPPDSEFELVSQGYFWAEVKNCDHDGQAEAMLIVTLNVKGTDIVVEKEIRACDTRKMEIIGPRDIEIPYYPVTYEIKDLPPGRNIVWDWRFYRDLLTTTISLPPAELEDVVILGTTNPDLIPEGEENSPILSKSEILGLLDGFEEDEIVGNDDHESDYILVKRLRVMMNPEHIGQPREESKIEANVRMVGCDELNLKPLTVYVGEKPKNEIRISYSPNPTANELIVEFINEHADTWTETDDSELNYSVKLYDNAGVVKRQTNHRRRKRDRESSVKFSISNLQEGTYYLHIESDGELEKHQIIVTK